MLEIERVTRLEAGAAERFTRIYEASFPESEREDVELLLASVAAGQRECYLALDDGTVVGLAVLLRLRATHVRFLEYLAVDPDGRGQGVGGRLLDRLREEPAIGGAAGGFASLGIVFEVEDPADAEGLERALRLRRIEFYRRHGADVVEGVPCFRAPNLDGEGTLAYRLMWLPARDGPIRLQSRLLHGTVEAILIESYGLPSDDPVVVAALADLAG
jgi:GNAT superfamily N-acetyltransferase